ncbi:diguanylate cyclase (GGDEF) domain-containing protein [Oscillospiraceae bacterium]|nr:diguanylate cyclase (GGDEF) domain-containing protein [Oscillospiraceae bacterium]
MKICAFIGDMYRDYSTAIILALQKKATERGHKINIFGNCSVPNENPLHAEGLKSVLTLPHLDRYDGIILCSDTLNHAGLSKELIDNLISTKNLPPVVSIRSDETGFYNVVPDNRKIMHDVAEHVISKIKDNDIGFVTGRDDLADSAERLAGFVDAMKEAGLEVRKDLIFHGNYWIDQGPMQADFFERPDHTLPKAIICSNDYMALALMDELIYRGYSIPADTMITGIDNFETSEVHIPSLTTSDIAEDTLANTAIETLERIVSGEDVDFYVSVPGRLIPRESTDEAMADRDIYEGYRELAFVKRTNTDRTRSFILLNTDYEDALSDDKCVSITLNSLKELRQFKSVFLCEFKENDREIVGYFEDNGDCIVKNIAFPSTELLPQEFLQRDYNVRLYLPIHYKNEVYGYCICELDPDAESFIDERLEFILVLFSQSLNRMQLYRRIFEVEDIMDLYVKDALTGLYNRRGFERDISALFENGVTKKYPLAVASIDMDGLKYINDTFGHSAGDSAIKAISECVTKALNPDEFAARMGGDEFEAVLILNSPGRVGQFIRTLRNLIKEANNESGADYPLSASIGTCEVREWSMLLECMNKADKAMYLEKKAKKAARGEAPR